MYTKLYPLFNGHEDYIHLVTDIPYCICDLYYLIRDISIVYMVCVMAEGYG